MTTTTSAIDELSANVLDTQFEDFDQATIDQAKNRVLDSIGCAIGAGNTPDVKVFVDLVKNWGGKEEATILVHGSKGPAQNVAMVNSIMARTLDFEPLSPIVEGKSILGHTSGTTVMTAITLGEVNGIDGKELITALLVGDNFASRVSAACGGSGEIFARGWGTTGSINLLGATAVAGRLLGLNKLQMRNAFGIALNQVTVTNVQSIWDGATTFKLPQGLSARNGIFAAELAKVGWTGTKDALLSRFGYFHYYGIDLDTEILTRDLGKKYYQDATIKRYPCCAATHLPINCALALVTKHDVNAEDIEEVILGLPRSALEGFCNKPFIIGDYPPCEAIYSYAYTLASALVRKCVKPEHFLEESIRDSQVNALINKIKMKELSEAVGRTQVEVRMKNGQVFSETDVEHDPMTTDEIIAKFRANVDFSQTVTREKSEKLLSLLENLEVLESVNKMVELSVI